jgi:hypothetical protein
VEFLAPFEIDWLHVAIISASSAAAVADMGGQQTQQQAAAEEDSNRELEGECFWFCGMGYSA